MARTATIVGLAMLLVSAIFAISLIPRGVRELGNMENIHGIPYPKLASGGALITEPLAHADIYLQEPVLAKELILEITYRPINVTSLAAGIREDSFWLSYGSRQEIYRDSTPGVELASSPGVRQAQVVIPLTDKLQEVDRSLDLMFFAEPKEDPQWELHRLEAHVTYAWPTYQEFRNYVRSILKRERAL